MKDKILNAIKMGIGKTNINEKTLNAYVDLIDDKISDESLISETVKPYISFLKDHVQGNINSVAAESVTAKEVAMKSEFEQKMEELTKSGTSNPPKEEKMDDTPEWAKALVGKVETLETTLGAFNAEKMQQTLTQKLQSTLNEKKIPDFYFNPAIAGRTFKDEAEVLAFADALGLQWETTKQALANQGFKETVPPANGSGNTDDIDSIVAAIDKGTEELGVRN